MPRLRFPEFAGEWQVNKLGDIAPLQRGFDLPNSKQRPGEFPIVFSNGPLKTHYKYMAKAPGVVTGRSGTIGEVHYVEKDYWPHNTSLWVTDFKNNDPKYIYIMYSRMQLEKFGGGSSVPTLNRNDVHAHKVALPSKAEQLIIASFFGAVDEKIDLLSKKKKQLEKYKKGVMQKLLSQEIRFKGANGQNLTNWQIKKLGELCNITTGKLDANAMSESGHYRFYTCARNYYHIDNYAFDTEALLISGNGANVGYIHYFKGKFNAYQRTYVLDNFSDNIKYIKIYLDVYLRKRIFQEKFEGNMPYIVLSTLADMRIPLPSDLEQQKIADFIGKIDQMLESEERKLEKAKDFKKALLQQMFV